MIQAIIYVLLVSLGFAAGGLTESLCEGHRVKKTIKSLAKDSRPVMVDGQLYKISEVTK